MMKSDKPTKQKHSNRWIVESNIRVASTLTNKLVQEL